MNKNDDKIVLLSAFDPKSSKISYKGKSLRNSHINLNMINNTNSSFYIGR